MSIFNLFQKRKIREVSSWDGSASNYSTPQAYAASSLINFNTVAGRSKDEWTKDLVALPVRSENDSKDTYIKQAVQAASGGRGITQVTKPDGVSQEDFDRLIRKAANEIIRAYSEWGGIAPDSVYKLAGKSRPEERAASMSEMFDKVSYSLSLADMAEDTYTYLIDVYYDDSVNRFFALGMREGKLYKMNVSVEADELMFGEFEEIPLTSSLTTRGNQLQVYRTKEGKRRWLAIASVATLNRVGEIDSTRLFDSFITYSEITKQFPVLNIYHLGKESVVGRGDFLARDGYVYIASGVFDETKYGQAVADGLENSQLDWGNSIEFLSFDSDIEQVEVAGATFQTRVHTVGINTGISILLEKDAASILTTHQSVNRGGVMKPEVKEALLQLFNGDESLIEEFEEKVGRANSIAMTRISRSVETEEASGDDAPEEEERQTTEQEQEVEEEVVEEEVEQEQEVEEEEIVEIELGETFVADLVGSEEFRSALEQMVAQKFAQYEQRMAQLETQVVENREWVDDAPAAKPKKRAVVSYRARNVEEDDAGVQVERKNFADVASETLDSIFSE